MFRFITLTVGFTIGLMGNVLAVQSDPTRPANATDDAVSAVLGASKPNLEAIFMTASGRKAIINGAVFLESQEMMGLRVIKIYSDKVDVEYQLNGTSKRESLVLSKTGSIKTSLREKQ